MIKRGFDVTASKEDIERLEDQMTRLEEQMATKEDVQKLEARLDHLDARAGRIEADIHELQEGVVYRHEFEDALGRIKYIERKLGIESGV